MIQPASPTLPPLDGASVSAAPAEATLMGDLFHQLIGQMAPKAEAPELASGIEQLPANEGEPPLPLAALIAAAALLPAGGASRSAPVDGEGSVATLPDTDSADPAGSPLEAIIAAPLAIPVATPATPAAVPVPAGQEQPVSTTTPIVAVAEAPEAQTSAQAALVAQAARLPAGPPAPGTAALATEPSSPGTIDAALADAATPAPVASVPTTAIAPVAAAAPLFADIVSATSSTAADMRPAVDAPLAANAAPSLDLAVESEWLDQIATDIARTAGKEGALRFRLHPESLGSLEVEIKTAAAGISVRMTTETEAARAIIADAQPRLAAEARAQGVRIAETHVDLGSQGQAWAGDQNARREAAPEPLLRTAAAPPEADEQNPSRQSPSAERYA